MNAGIGPGFGYTLLSSMAILTFCFSPNLFVEVVQPLRPYFVGLVRPISNAAQRVSAVAETINNPSTIPTTEEDIGLVSVSILFYHRK